LTSSADAASPKDTSGTFRKLARSIRINRLFLLTVVMPTVLAAIYFGLIASDVYISESRFVVRSPQRPMQSGFLGTLLQGTTLSRTLDDAYAVHDYIVSRDALKELDDQFALARMFGSAGIDFLSRFPALDWDDSFEGLHRYYRRRVSVELDSGSSISVLRVSAFSARDARQINEKLLEMSEGLANRLSVRSRQDIVRYASAQVQEAEQRAKAAAVALAEFRTQKSVIDPERQSAAQLQQVAKLQDELIATKTQIAQLRVFTPENPQLPVLGNRLEALQREISAELAKVTGGGGSLSNKAAPYVRLALEREFADKQLGAAMALLESARSEAQKQQLYLDRIVAPHLPDYAVEPRRARSVAMVLVLGLLAWGVLSLLLASIREHLA